MKTTYTIIAAALLSVLLSISAQAQEIHHGETFELNQTLPQNASYEYHAADHIELNRGFFSRPQIPNYAMMDIDPYFNPETPYGVTHWNPIDCYGADAGRVGVYPMDFEVNDNGAAVINMPLEFPEGINGMMPHLSLNYNSQGGNGIMGLGWSLGGMSKISRVPYNYIYNDSCSAVHFSNEDQLSLDGVTLIKGTKDGKICYYPEIYDYSIVYPINDNGSFDNGFRVLKKDGNVYTYAAKYYLQQAIATPIEWHLSRVEDPFGNYIVYEYENDRDEGAFFPTHIRYTGTSNSAPTYELAFRYYGGDERVDCPRKWFSKPDDNKTGFSRINKKLTDIECWYGDKRIICYNLAYINLDWRITVLCQVNRYTFDSGSKNGPSNMLAPTQFKWTNVDYQLQYETASENVCLNTNYNPDHTWQQYTAFAARFEQNKSYDNDLEKYENDIVHLMEDREGGFHYFLNVIKNNNIIGEQGQAYHYNELGTNYNCGLINGINGAFGDGRIIVGFFPADTDGDGLNEIVCASYYASIPGVRVTLIKPNVSGVFYETESFAYIHCSNQDDIKNLSIGDFNGDGLSDLFYLYDDDYYSYFSVCLSSVDQPFSYSMTNSCIHYSNRKIAIGDFDGSKKDQIIMLGKINNNIFGYYYHVFKNQNGNNVISGPKRILEDIFDKYFNHSCRRLCIGDFNGDGKKDILLLCALDWRFYFSKGNGYFDNAILNTDSTNINDDYINTNEGNENVPAFMLITDLDDDGYDDFSVLKVKRIGHNMEYYMHFFRRDFLIRPTNNPDEILIDKKQNLRYWWQNGQQFSTDITIDSIKLTGDYYARFNPFIAIMGNHKGTSPIEIMSCRMGSRTGTYNLGLYLHNTGCLNNPPVRAINKIITSLGATTEIVYRPVSYQFERNQVYGRELENRDLTPILPFYGYLNIVERVLSETNEKWENSTLTKTFRMTRYHFSQPYFHTRGRGFLGFSRVWSRKQGYSFDDNPNHSNDLFTTKTFSINDTYQILVPDFVRTDRFASDNHQIIEQCDKTDFEYSFNNNTTFESDLGQIPNGVFAPYLSSSTSKHDIEGPIHYEKETFLQDGFGNTTDYYHFYGISETYYPYYEKKIVAYDNRINENRWLIGIPKTEFSEFLLDDRANNPLVIKNTTYKNDLVTGRHQKKTTEPGNEKQLTETYGYDNFGNLVSTTLTGGGVTRTQSIHYSDDGRFPIASTNALGHTTHYYFDEATGRTDSIKDPNGLTTCYRYDILGNLIQTKYPSGVLEDQSMMWVGSPQQQNYHPDTPDFGYPIYFTYSKRSGQGELYIFYDQHRRKLREVSHTMDGKKAYVDYNYYDITGLLQSVSAPYYPDLNEEPQFTSYSYDYLDRTTRINRPDGGFMTHTYYQSSKEKTVGFDGRTNYLYYSPSGLIARSCSNESDTRTHLNFTYYGDGKLFKSETESNNNPQTRITRTYDINRNPQSIIDPTLGTLTYDYNAFGELTHSTTPRDETHYTYDALGRMKTRIGTDGNSYWNYDYGFKGVLSDTRYQPTEGPSEVEKYTYNHLGQLTRQTQTIEGQPEWAFNYTYNRLGQQSTITYPSGRKFKYHYDGNGFMEWVMDIQSSNIIWQANASDRWGNITDFTEGDIQVTYNYDPITGLVNGINATRDNQTLIEQAYHWTPKGNLNWRTDATLDLKESFGYDGLNRLTSATGTDLGNNTTYFTQSFSFDPKGNITAKTGMTGYDYNSPTNPYAVTGVQPEAGQESLFADQTIFYTSFDKLRSIEQNGNLLTVGYGIDRQRVTQVLETENAIRTKRYFTPLFETVTENGVTKKLHYLTAGTGLFAIFASYNTGGSTMHYTLKDHQGSLAATVCGNTVERLSYDAWGRRRNPNGFGYGNVSHTFDRGYTLHEHYDHFDLINMNGRLYDPVIGRMLSPDIAIQDENSVQAYNRYSYCFNNPLRFTDPSGYFVTIPPEFVEMFEYAQDKEYFRDCIMELGINPNTVQYNTDETEGIRKTTVSWMIGNDKYEMVKFDYIYLKDYYQQNRNGCAAISFWALEAQHHPGTYFDENYFMECIPNSYTEGTSVRELCEIFVGTQIEDNYFPGISETYHLYHEKEIFDSNREELLKECFDAFHDGDAMMFLLPSTTIKHDVNATAAARLQINGRSTLNDYSVWIWDSGKTNGGYKPLDLKNVLYRFIIAK